jgi:hypothetical protein
MPPQLASWASSLQLSGLGAQQAEIARQFLSRAGQLNPEVRAQMSHRITSEVVSRISPPPPPGTPALLILAAVLAERHRRELARLQVAAPSPGWLPPRPAVPQLTYPSLPQPPQPTLPRPHSPPLSLSQDPPGGFTPPS